MQVNLWSDPARIERARGYVEDPVCWMNDLGHTIGHESDDGDWSQWSHPIADSWRLAELLDAHSDDDAVLEALRAEGLAAPESVALALIDYARSGLASGREIEILLTAAVDAASGGDLDGVLSLLDRASSAEREWGDDPSVRGVRRALAAPDGGAA